MERGYKIKKLRRSRKIRRKRFIIFVIMLSVAISTIISGVKWVKNYFTAYTQSKYEEEGNPSTNKSEDESIVKDEKKIEESSDREQEENQNPYISEEFIKDKIDSKVIIDHTKRQDYKEIFKKDVFIGDSITNGLSFYGLLEDKNVVARLGDTLIKAKSKVDGVAKLKPENIYIFFGANDLEDPISSEEFIKRYRNLISNLKERLPNSNIYVQSILPVTEKVQLKKPYVTNTRINEFNGALMDMAKEEGIEYINIASILENIDTDLHESDGIHFKFNFYYLWLNYLIDYVK